MELPPGPQAGEARSEALLKLERDLQIARRIQESFLPGEIPRVPGWEIDARCRPARAVGGDFYDVFPLSQHRRVGLVLGDICDKGVGAALFMALVRTLVRAFAQQPHAMSWADRLTGPASALETAPSSGRRRELPSVGTGALKNAVALTNNYLIENHGATGMFATLFFGVLDPSTGQLTYVNAGHPPPVLVGADGEPRRLSADRFALGILPDHAFTLRQATLEPGARLLAFTDGVTDAKDPSGGFFGEERLIATVMAESASAAVTLDRIEAAVEAHRAGTELFDDATLLAARRLARG